MRTQIVTWLGVLAFGAPVMAQSTQGARGVSHEQSTYVPGQSESNPGVEAYSQRGTAVEQPQQSVQLHRGGGPSNADDGSPATGSSVAHARRRHTQRQRVLRSQSGVSDNQTRRPGAENYTGASFGGGPRDEHRLPSAPGVSMVGDDFGAGTTGSATTGKIPVRAASSNEREVQPLAPIRVFGGGPRAERSELGPNSVDEVPVASGPLTWDAPIVAQDAVLAAPPFSKADLAQLPFPGDGTARAGDGLLSMVPVVRSSELNDTASVVSATPARFELGTNYPLLTRAVGGGPSDSRAPQPLSERILRGQVRVAPTR